MSATPPPQYPVYPPPPPLSPADEKLWSTLTHVGGIFFDIIPSLITYLVFKDRGPFVRAHTATALNFQLTMLIVTAAIVLIAVLTFGIGAFLTFPFAVYVLIVSILGAVAANKGEWYRYPLTINFLQ